MARQRDENGRFLPGHNGGPGRPPKKREERFLQITMQACTFKDWREVVKKAVAQAKTGDSAARKWLSDYLLGPPVQRLEHTGEGGNPIEMVTIEVIKDYGENGRDNESREN